MPAYAATVSTEVEQHANKIDTTDKLVVLPAANTAMRQHPSPKGEGAQLLTNVGSRLMRVDAALAVKVPDALRHPAHIRALHQSSNLQASRERVP